MRRLETYRRAGLPFIQKARHGDVLSLLAEWEARSGKFEAGVEAHGLGISESEKYRQASSFE